MTSKKVIAICQFGGEFLTDENGSMVYNGGDAHIIDLDEGTKLDDFRREVSETFDLDGSFLSLKYFLPGNKKTLITVSKDKDLTRMISFVSELGTVDVFVSKDDIPAQAISILPTLYAVFMHFFFLKKLMIFFMCGLICVWILCMQGE